MSYDITFCKGQNCPLKETCKRNKYPKDVKYLSFFVTPLVKDSKCEYYWEDKNDN